MDQIDNMERQERMWVGVVATVCIALLIGSIFLLSLSYRIGLPV